MWIVVVCVECLVLYWLCSDSKIFDEMLMKLICEIDLLEIVLLMCKKGIF